MTHTSTPYYTYTYTPTRYPTFDPSYGPTREPTDTPTPTITQTPTVTPTPGCTVTLDKPGPTSLVGNGGIGRFHLKTVGCPGVNITLNIVRTAGTAGSAVFVDSNSPALTVTGDVDRIVKVRTGTISDVPYNMQVRATNPTTGAVAIVPFTVFWTVPSGQYTGPVPDEATGAMGPLKDQMKRLRGDGKNLLGFAIGEKDNARGLQLMRYSVVPDGIPNWDFRSGGPGDGFDAKRRRWTRAYKDGCVVFAVDDQVESSAAVLKSLIPTAEAGVLNIYDLDGPSLPKTVPDNKPPAKAFVRNRSNFIAWSVYTDDDGIDRRASDDYSWFFRASWDVVRQKWSGVPQLDNMVGAGSTPLTYDLQPPVIAPDFSILTFTPQSAPNSQGSVEISISGVFPDIPGSQCEWLVYLLSAGGDPNGDPESSTDADYIPGTQVVKNGANNITARFTLSKGPSVPRGPSLPFPAKAYTLYVVRDSEAKPGPVPFVVTENPFDHWTIYPFGQLNDNTHTSVSILVYAKDANDNVVSRPGQPGPTITVLSGTPPLTRITSTRGADGEYYIQATKPAGVSGLEDIQASGGGVPTVTTTVAIPK